MHHLSLLQTTSKVFLIKYSHESALTPKSPVLLQSPANVCSYFLKPSVIFSQDESEASLREIPAPHHVPEIHIL